ncbi:MAG: DUF1566 domain-containing protein [Bacteroidota bacterium]
MRKNLLYLLFIFLVFSFSCGSDDEALMAPTAPEECDLDCGPNGTCLLDVCACDPGYVGDQCQTYRPVAVRLQTETPAQIVARGIPVDSLYGKEYAGGIIFYLDQSNFLVGVEGLVCSATDIAGTSRWGCTNIDLENVPNVQQTPNRPFSNEAGSLLGDGKTNTPAISNNNCASGSAARACATIALNGYSDWYLPSSGALELMYENLDQNGMGDFRGQLYWSSSERAATNAWYLSFQDGTHANTNKLSSLRVRAIREF